MSEHFEFFDRLRSDRGIAFEGKARIVSHSELEDILPHYWREERVASPAEWFVRTGRGLGFDIRHRPERSDFYVTRSR